MLRRLDSHDTKATVVQHIPAYWNAVFSAEARRSDDSHLVLAERPNTWRPAAGLLASPSTYVPCAVNRNQTWAAGSRRAHFIPQPHAKAAAAAAARASAAAPASSLSPASPLAAAGPASPPRLERADGLVPGYSGFVPHLRSNAIPGASFGRLTRDGAAAARTDARALRFLPESRRGAHRACAAAARAKCGCVRPTVGSYFLRPCVRADTQTRLGSATVLLLIPRARARARARARV